MWWEWFPGLGFGKGPRAGEGVPVPAPSAQFQSLSQMGRTPSVGLQQQEWQEQHSPGEWEEAGGSAVTDAM